MDRPKLQIDCRDRLARLASEWGMDTSPAQLRLERPATAPSFRTPEDDVHAQELLKRRRLQQQLQSGGSHGGLSRGLTIKKKGYEQKEVLDALAAHVAASGSPGIAEALIAQLVTAGGSISGAPAKTKAGLLSRRRSVELSPPPQQSIQMLRQTVESDHYDMVQVLAPHAGSFVLDAVLPVAIAERNARMVELLLRYGASLAGDGNATSQNAFRQTCAAGGHSSVVELVMAAAADGRAPPSDVVSAALVDAARAGCLETVLALGRSGLADGNYDSAAALKVAVARGRRDIALAIICSCARRPPRWPGLHEAFSQLFSGVGRNFHPNERLAMAEILLCAGANGDVVDDALIQASADENLEMVNLLVSFGASLEGQGCLALRRAVAGAKTDLVATLLGDGRGQVSSGRSPVSPTTPLSPLYASECLEAMPREGLTYEERRVLLEALLRKGARGPALDEALVSAANAGDLEAVKLLLNPLFPQGMPVGSPTGSRSMVFERHEVASVDYGNGQALQIAVTKGHMPMVKVMLGARPTAQTLASAFQTIWTLPPIHRHEMVEAFLAAGCVGPAVDAALQQEVEQLPPNRDDRIIDLLIGAADVNYNSGASIGAAVTQADTKLLQLLLKKRPSPEVLSTVLPRALAIPRGPVKLQILDMLLGAGAASNLREISKALIGLLQTKPVDRDVLTILLRRGNADVNFSSGKAIEDAILDDNPATLRLLLESGRASKETVGRGFMTLTKLKASEIKEEKLALLLQYDVPKDILSTLLIAEVISVLRTPQEQRRLANIKTLLTHGADVNASNGQALCEAVSAADTQITEMLLTAAATKTSSLRPATKSFALRRALDIADPMDRLSLTRCILDSDVDAKEANRAACYAIKDLSDDTPLISALVARADITDGHALALAIHREKADALKIVLARHRFSAGMLVQAFERVPNATDRAARLAMARILLDEMTRAGVKDVPSDAVLASAIEVAARDGDLALGRLLLDYQHQRRRTGTSGPDGRGVEGSPTSILDVNGGRAIIDACRAGAVDVLEMLLAHRADDCASSPAATVASTPATTVKMRTLERGWQAATEVGDLERRAAVFRVLLRKGVRGILLDEQLVSAVRYGGQGEPLVRLLLRFGANPDYNDGEPVLAATRSAGLGSLGMLLGVESVEGEQVSCSYVVICDTVSCVYTHFFVKQRKPSASTLTKAFKEAWRLSGDVRHQVISWLFAAGLPVQEDVHATLHTAILEDVVDRPVVELLMSHGASPLTNGCATLVACIRRLLLPVLERMLQDLDIPVRDLSWAFSNGLKSDNASDWLTPLGLSVMKLLLEKGASGDGPGAALITVIESSSTMEEDLYNQFLQCLLKHGANVSYRDGLVLRRACEATNVALVKLLIQQKPTTHAVSMTFPYIFQEGISEQEALELVTLFSENSSGDEPLESIPTHPDVEPPLFRALDRFPRSTKMLETLLNLGYYHDQATRMSTREDEEPEDVSALLWALLQPQKKISSAVIKVLIDRKANVNFTTRITKTTPLMVAIQTRRPDVVEELLIAGAEVDITNSDGVSPLAIAAAIGGDLGVQMMALLLKVEPSQNDGSLHNAARELNIAAMILLVKYGHQPDFPSPLHGGRSALGELCLHASDALPDAGERQMERAIKFLMDMGSDPEIRTADGKSVLHLALEASDPVTTTRALLKAFMWEHVNKPFNRYTDGTYTYSPTAYVSRVLFARTASESATVAAHTRDALLSLLRSSRCVDVYYSNNNPQPPDAVGVPQHLVDEERARKTRESILAAQQEDHTLAIRRVRELAAVELTASQERAEAELAARERAHAQSLAHLRDTARAQQDAAMALAATRRVEERAELAHAEAMAAQRIAAAMQLREHEEAAESSRQQRLLAWEDKMSARRIAEAKQIAAVKVDERRDIERIEAEADKRLQARLKEQKRIVDAKAAMMDRYIAAAGGNANTARRQIGFVLGETE